MGCVNNATASKTMNKAYINACALKEKQIKNENEMKYDKLPLTSNNNREEKQCAVNGH